MKRVFVYAMMVAILVSFACICYADTDDDIKELASKARRH